MRGSWFDPGDAASTVAVFATRVDARAIEDTGSLADWSARVAAAAPGQQAVSSAMRSAGGRTYYELCTFAGGGTAGRFGGAYELKALTVSGGLLWECRATASFAQWRVRRVLLQRCVASFRVS